jgi:hypothetical protein
MQYVIKNGDYVLFGPASFSECQGELEENLCRYRDHGCEPTIEEAK